MLRKLYTQLTFSVIALLISGGLHAQCSPSIPPSAQQKDGTVLFGTSGDTVWLCPGANLSLESAFGSVDNVVVYAEENSSVSLDDADGNDGNIIHHQGGGQVYIGSNATNTTVRHASNTTINDNGTSTSTNDCGSITYDYSNAPPDSCGAQSLRSSSPQQAEPMVKSIGDRFKVEVPSELLHQGASLSIELFDMLGNKVYKRSITKSEQFLTPDLPAGIYLYRLRKDGEALDAGKLGKR